MMILSLRRALPLAPVLILLSLALAACSSKSSPVSGANAAGSSAAATSGGAATSGTAASGAATTAASTGAPAFHAVIDYLQGSVTLNGAPASIGESVKENDELQTGADGSAEVTFDGANIVQIEPNSVARLSPRTLTLPSGAAALVLKGLQEVASGDRFRVATPTAVGGVRGTVFFVKVESPTRTYICLCNGQLALENPQFSQIGSLRAAHHKAIRFVSDGGTVVLQPAPLLYHDDAQMEKLAKKIGYTIDWSKVD